jgi:hypothetical protein
LQSPACGTAAVATAEASARGQISVHQLVDHRLIACRRAVGDQRTIANLTTNFWFGHQGYEYLDLGRFWQIYLFIGLLLWMLLVLRGLWPLVRRRDTSRSLLFLVILSTVSIGLLFGAGLFWGEHTHISIMEYWRWWVVHLWVEGGPRFATAIVSRWSAWNGAGGAATTGIGDIIFLGGGVREHFITLLEGTLDCVGRARQRIFGARWPDGGGTRGL